MSMQNSMPSERPDDDYRHALDVCRRQGRRLKDLVETLLGLAISKAVVDAHDGSIRCETSEAGTTFVVELPAAKACPGTA
jgi:signal transduction histidine kinase